jgi:YVTN family beta-propeller protein
MLTLFLRGLLLTTTCALINPSRADNVGSPPKAKALAKALTIRTLALPDRSRPSDVQVVGSRLVVACPGTKNLMVLSGHNHQKTATIRFPINPYFIRRGASGKLLYVTSVESSTIVVLNAVTMAVAREVHLPKGARLSELAVSKDGRLAFVADHQKPILFVVDLAKGVVKKKVPLSAPGLRVVLDEPQQRIYVASIEADYPERPTKPMDLRSKVDFIDALELKRIHTVTLPENSFVSLCVGAKSELFVLSMNVLRRIDTRGKHIGRVSDNTKLQGPGVDVVYDPDARLLYASTGIGLNIIDPRTLKVVKRATGGVGLISMEKTKLGRHIYMAGEGTDTISEVFLPEQPDSPAGH